MAISLRLKRPLTFAALVAVAVVPTVGQTPQDRTAAADLLHRRGLVARGELWELQAEPLLRRRLAKLRTLLKQIGDGRRQLESAIGENAVRWRQVGPQVAALEKKLKSLPTDHQDRPGLRRQLAQLRRQAAPPDRLAEVPQVVARVKQLVDWELTAAAHRNWCQQTLRRVRQQRRETAESPDVGRALRMLQAELAPETPYRDADQLLEEVGELVSQPYAQVYREGGQWRIGALLDDRWPATFSLLPDSDQLLLPASLAAAIEAGEDPSRTAQRLEVERGRRVLATPVRIGRLQIGDVVLSQVPAWRLPPEAEELGARLGGYALPGLRLELQAPRLRVAAEHQ